MHSSLGIPMRSDERNRREVVGSGASAAAVALAAAAGPAVLLAAGALAKGADQPAIVASMLAAEQTAAVAYGAAAAAGLLTKPLTDVARLFHDQAEAHAGALAPELRALGGKPPRRRRPEDVKGLAGLRSEAEFIAFAIQLENAAVRRHVEALQVLQTPKLLGTVARIMASCGQHLVILRQELSADPADWVPDAFETGSSPAPAET